MKHWLQRLRHPFGPHSITAVSHAGNVSVVVVRGGRNVQIRLACCEHCCSITEEHGKNHEQKQ